MVPPAPYHHAAVPLARTKERLTVGEMLRITVWGGGQARTKWTRRVLHPVLTGHAASLTQAAAGVPLRSILLLTFSTAAAKELETRVKKECPPSY